MYIYAKSEMFILNSGTVEPTMGGWVRERLKQWNWSQAGSSRPVFLYFVFMEATIRQYSQFASSVRGLLILDSWNYGAAYLYSYYNNDAFDKQPLIGFRW